MIDDIDNKKKNREGHQISVPYIQKFQYALVVFQNVDPFFQGKSNIFLIFHDRFEEANIRCWNVSVPKLIFGQIITI